MTALARLFHRHRTLYHWESFPWRRFEGCRCGAVREPNSPFRRLRKFNIRNR